MRFIGIDLHHDMMVAAIIDSGNNINTIKIKLHSKEFKDFINELTTDDYIAVESSTNSFWFYDKVEDKVKECFIINTWKFLEMFKTNKKTDKIDAKKLAKKLRYRIIAEGDEDDLPTVFVPVKEVQWLRSLFSTYQLLNKQKVMIMNRVYSIMAQNGFNFKKSELFNRKLREAILNCEMADSFKFQVNILYKQHDNIEEEIKGLKEKILEEGKIFEHEIDKIVGIDGISVFIAIAIMTDIADVKRFKSSKKLTSYLRSSPKVEISNKSVKIGHVNKQSRKLALTLLSQGLMHIYKSYDYYINFYNKKRNGKSAGKVRIAIARKIFSVIYKMLTNDEHFKWINAKNHDRKMKEYKYFLEKRA